MYSINVLFDQDKEYVFESFNCNNQYGAISARKILIKKNLHTSMFFRQIKSKNTKHLKNILFLRTFNPELINYLHNKMNDLFAIFKILCE